MRVSFYRDLTWLIGILVAIEILLKIGYRRGLILLIADLAVVLLMTFLFHRMRIGGYDNTALQLAATKSSRQERSESEWQKKHDQWWKAHRQLKGSSASQSHFPQVTKSIQRPSTPGSTFNLSQLERSNRWLKARINVLNSKINVLENSQKKTDSYRNTDWYRKIIKMKKQIARLKSEYK